VNATAGVRNRASDDTDTGHGSQKLMVTGATFYTGSL
jgi:hypothetical protein